MRDLPSFPWPAPPGVNFRPRWTGRHFDLGDRHCHVLSYTAESSHWSEDLTRLHEATAGQDHPIDRASRSLAVETMRRLPMPVPIIADVGCSSGYFLDDLKAALPHATLIGADYLLGPLETLAQRLPDIPIIQFDLRKCPLPDNCLDGITCLNVLEHIDDHEAALSEIHRLLKPGGLAHVEVPAGPSLYDIYDQHLMHHRRYQITGLASMARRLGFLIDEATHLGFMLYPGFVLTKRLNRLHRHLPEEQKAAVVAQHIRKTHSNPLFKLLTRLELFFGRHTSYPVGIRCVLVLRKA